MRRLVVALLAFCSLAATTPPDPSKLIETYVVNLDLPPEERWVALVVEKAAAIRGLVDIITPILLPHKTSIELIAAVNKTLPSEYIREMQGIAGTLKMDLERVIMANIFYEITGVVNTSLDLSRSCTSLVAQRSNGTVYIARNQDYPPPFTLLMVHAIFQRANKTVYEGTTYAGTIGLSTAAIFSPGGGFALSIDARENPLQGSAEGQDEAVAAAKRGAAVFPIMTRQACELTNNFAAAVTFLSTKEMIMPGYLIIAGGQPGEGAIITRNATANSTDVLTLFDKVHDEGGGDWYVAETNFDHWKPEPDYPLTNVTRRGTATKVLNSIGSDAIDLLGLWNVLDTYPVYNLATIHTDLISVAWAEYKTYKRHGPLSA
jgi:hypothetical protein